VTDQPTVLAIDDTHEVLSLLTKILAKTGYRVLSANNGELGLAAALSNTPDLILLDIRMKGMDGLEVCRRLKAREETRQIPIILVSAFAESSEWIEGLHLGAVDYVTKPFQVDELRARVKTHLSLGLAQQALEKQTSRLGKVNEQLQLEIAERRRAEGELRESLERAERSRRALLSTLEDQRHAEGQTAERARQQALIAYLGQAALSGMDLSDLMGQAVRRVAELLDVELCKVLEVAPDHKFATLRAGVGWHDGLVGHATVPLGLDSQAGFTLQNKEPVVVGDLRTETRFSGPQLLHDHQVISGISTIIGTADAPVGILGVHTTRPRQFVANDVHFLQGVANLLATAVQGKLTEDALKQERSLYKDLVETQPAGVYRIRVQHRPNWSDGTWRDEVDTRYSVEMASSRFLEITGISQAEFTSNPGALPDRIHPEDRADFVRKNVDALANGTKFSWEGRICRGHETVWIHFESVPRTLQNGDQVWTGILYDFTQSRLAEAERKRLLAAIEQTGEVVFLTDTGGSIQYVNPAFTAVTGYGRDEAIGRTPNLLRSGKHSEEFYRDLWQTITEGRVFKGRIVNRRKDGTLFTEDATISPVFDIFGKVVNFVAVNRDITETLQLEEQLRASQKMEAIGVLAGGVAHDFNNLLSVVLSFTRFAIEGLEETDPQLADLVEVRNAGERAAALTRQLLAFSRKQVLEPQAFQLNHLVSELANMLRRLIGEDIALSCELQPDLGLVRADPGQIEQVVMNLVINARDAMPNGGKVTLETTNVELDEEYACRHVAVVPGSYVLLAISDNGCGMDLTTRQRLFEPFFTTKDKDKGTGLGLSTVYGIVKQSNGNIWVYSELGIGTTFKVYLPRLLDGQIQAEQREASLRPPVGNETILVVEDEEPVRRGTARMLEAAGYTVLLAANADEAIRIFTERKGKIDLLLTDVIMPIVSGRQLAAQLRARYAALKVLYMSGYTDNAIVHHGVLDPGTKFISKPFDPATLARKVRNALDGGANANANVATPAVRPISLSPKHRSVSTGETRSASETSSLVAEVRSLPTDIKIALRTAAVAARYDDIVALLDPLRVLTPALAGVILKHTKRFDYSRILKLLEEPGTGTDTKEPV